MKHATILTPGGERLVLVPVAEYEAMIAVLEDVAEDEADARVAAERLREIGDAPALSIAESGATLAGSGFLKAARKAKGLTQMDVADAAGIAQGFYSDIESGRRRASDDTMAKLADALGLPKQQFCPDR